MIIEVKKSPVTEGSYDLIVNGKTEVKQEGFTVVDNIRSALLKIYYKDAKNNYNHMLPVTTSEADEIAEAILQERTK